MDNSNIKSVSFHLAIVLIGCAAVTSQLLLIREIVNIFSGNELLFGLTIFSWLILYALGSGWLGRLSTRIKHKSAAFVSLLSLTVLLLPAEIFLARVIRNLFGLQFGALADLFTTVLIIVILLAPITLALGFLFSLSSALFAEVFENDPSQISQIYILEALGSLGGGLLLTYLLLFFFNAFEIASLLIMTTSLALALLGRILARKKIIALGFVILLLASALAYYAPQLDFRSTQESFKGLSLIKTADSPYGRIMIAAYKSSFSYFENGALLFSSADRLMNEELAHLSLLMHPRPRQVLLIGGGLSGVIDEILKYPDIQLDYLELDYKIIALSRQYMPFAPLVNILQQDGVKYLKQSGKQYDIILINLPDPSTALINRYYTREFFSLCRKRLGPTGILSFHLSTSGAYLGRELKLLNRSINKTVSQVFRDVLVVPGNYNYFFASDSELLKNRYELFNRWEQRRPKTMYFGASALNHILWPDRLNYVKKAIEFDKDTPVNTEFRPISYYFGLLIWISYFHQNLKHIFYSLMKIDFPIILLALLVVLLTLKVLSRRIRSLSLPTIIALLGFTGMAAQLIIIYSFQSLYGYVYQTIGLLTTAFMTGLALGSYETHKNQASITDPHKMLRITIALLIAFLLILALTIKVFPLPIASLVLALPIGVAFPLAVRIQKEHKKEIGHLAGILYGSDLLGGALAAILTTIFLIPVFGIYPTLILAIIMALASLLMAFS